MRLCKTAAASAGASVPVPVDPLRPAGASTQEIEVRGRSSKAGRKVDRSHMNVLYINHTGQISGAEKSLLEIVRTVPGHISPVVACPDGPLAGAIAELGVERAHIPGTDTSLKVGPRESTAALWWLFRGALAVRAIARHHRADVVHANSIRAGLLTTPAARLGGPPTIVHIRDRLPPTAMSRLALRTIAKADALIANSRYTAESLAAAGATQSAHVLGNPIDLDRLRPESVDRCAARAALGLRKEDVVATVLAQITPWKGQEDAIRAIAEARQRHPTLKLLLVGSAKFVSKATRYDNASYLEELRGLVASLDLSACVEFVGERDDIPSILRATDILLVPSWEEPFGRSVIEAMAMQVPVIATNVGGPAEVISDGADGLLLPPRQPSTWAAAITTLIESPWLRDRIARNGRVRSSAFGSDAHTEALADLYETVIDASRRQVNFPATATAAKKAHRVVR